MFIVCSLPEGLIYIELFIVCSLPEGFLYIYIELFIVCSLPEGLREWQRSKEYAMILFLGAGTGSYEEIKALDVVVERGGKKE